MLTSMRDPDELNRPRGALDDDRRCHRWESRRSLSCNDPWDALPPLAGRRGAGNVAPQLTRSVLPFLDCGKYVLQCGGARLTVAIATG
jgi:hypothetical protein